jgi:hypothetical protein
MFIHHNLKLIRKEILKYVISHNNIFNHIKIPPTNRPSPSSAEHVHSLLLVVFPSGVSVRHRAVAVAVNWSGLPVHSVALTSGKG